MWVSLRSNCSLHSSWCIRFYIRASICLHLLYIAHTLFNHFFSNFIHHLSSFSILNVSNTSTMAAQIGLLSMTQIQKFSKSQNQSQGSNPNSRVAWMWNPRTGHPEDDDSWEVRAFAEDTRSVMGTTWPPRSYTCTFCRREFRSAQALGGHMNVHRRDRARLHQVQPPGSLNPTPSFTIPAQEFVSNGGLCLFYHLQSPSNGTFTTPTTVNACPQSPPTFIPISPYPPNNSISSTASPSFDFQASARSAINSSYYSSPSGKVEESKSSSNDNGCEELDLELRLGHKPTPTWQRPTKKIVIKACVWEKRVINFINVALFCSCVWRRVHMNMVCKRCHCLALRELHVGILLVQFLIFLACQYVFTSLCLKVLMEEKLRRRRRLDQRRRQHIINNNNKGIIFKE